MTKLFSNSIGHIIIGPRSSPSLINLKHPFINLDVDPFPVKFHFTWLMNEGKRMRAVDKLSSKIKKKGPKIALIGSSPVSSSGQRCLFVQPSSSLHSLLFHQIDSNYHPHPVAKPARCPSSGQSLIYRAVFFTTVRFTRRKNFVTSSRTPEACP